MIEVRITPASQFIELHGCGFRVDITWQEANALQADLRKLLAAEGITMRDAV